MVLYSRFYLCQLFKSVAMRLISVSLLFLIPTLLAAPLPSDPASSSSSLNHPPAPPPSVKLSNPTPKPALLLHELQNHPSLTNPPSPPSSPNSNHQGYSPPEGFFKPVPKKVHSLPGSPLPLHDEDLSVQGSPRAQRLMNPPMSAAIARFRHAVGTVMGGDRLGRGMRRGGRRVVEKCRERCVVMK